MMNSNVAKNVDREVFVEEGSFRDDISVNANPVVTQDGAVLLLEEGIEAIELFLLQVHHEDDWTGVQRKSRPYPFQREATIGITIERTMLPVVTNVTSNRDSSKDSTI